MITPFTEVQYLEEARDRVTEQFKDKTVFDKYLQLLIDQQDSIQQVFKDLIQKRSIDEATGATLDIIGEIVGQPRELISADLFNFFGFQAFSYLTADTNTIIKTTDAAASGPDTLRECSLWHHF